MANKTLLTNRAGMHMNRIFIFAVVLIMAFALSACGVEMAAADLQANADRESDYEIMTKVYTDQRTPDGFYQESLPDTWYTIRHLKNTDLLEGVVPSGTPVYGLGTDDFTEALNWSETIALQQAVYEQLVDTTETDLYFQFTRFSPGTPDNTHYSRVFKSSSLDRSGYDLGNPGIYLGMITWQPLTAEQVKYVIEYLWTFTFNNNYGNAVLESYTEETDSEFIHTMTEARLIMDYAGNCDTIQIFDTQYSVQKTDGMIFQVEYLIREFYSERIGNDYQVCEQFGG